MVLPSSSPWGGPPPAPPASHDDWSRNAVAVSNNRWVSTNAVISTYSAIAGSWPTTLQIVTSRGSDGTSIRSIPAAGDCKSLSRGASGKSFFQMWLTTISASAKAGIRRWLSPISGSTVVSSLSAALARTSGAIRPPKSPRKRTFIGKSSTRGHHVDQLLAADAAADIVGDLVPSAPHHALGPARIVRRHDDVGQFVKRMARAAPLGLCRIGILPPDIERRAADGPVAQRGIDRILVDHLAACDVDEERGRLHQRKAAGVDQPGGLGPERGAQRHGVAFGQHPVELGQREDSFDNGLGGTRAAVRGQNANAKRRRAPRHLLPDAAIADNTERRAANLAVRHAALDPAGAPRGALAELAGDLDEPMIEGEPHHHDVFGDRRFVPERVADQGAARQCREVEELDPRGHRLHQPDLRHWRVFGAPVVAD